MILVAAGMFIAYIVTFVLMPFIIRIARINKLYDIPDERKTHTYSISSLGGVGIIAGLSISLLLVTDFTAGDSVFQYYLAAIFIIFMLGVIDDLFVLHPLKKILGQLLVAFILTTKAHLLITNLEGLAGIYEISTTVGYILTFFTIILVINSFNLIDGVDGLAASVGLLSCLAFGLFFYINGDVPYAILSFTMGGSLLAFLVFNFAPARIFMGDSGSMLLGLVNAILLIRFIETDNPSAQLPVYSSITLGFGILLIPLLDVLRVFVIRLTKGKSPFTPDRNHIHHLLLNKGLTHTKVTLTLIVLTIFFITLSYFINPININLVAGLLILSFFIIVFGIKYLARSKQLHVVDDEENLTVSIQDTKVLTLYGTENISVNEREKAAPVAVNINQPKKKID